MSRSFLLAAALVMATTSCGWPPDDGEIQCTNDAHCNVGYWCPNSGDGTCEEGPRPAPCGTDVTWGGATFLAICGDRFTMGCEDGRDVVVEGCDDEELPPHEVTLTGTVWVGQTETTHAQFESAMGYSTSASTCADCPVGDVTWHQAAAYANALSVLLRAEPCYPCDGAGAAVQCTRPTNPYACEGFRLPTEAEWEFAARGDQPFVYAGSDDADMIASWEGNSGAAAPVASYDPNGFDLYDLSGNVNEWINDLYGDGYYADSPGTDPVGPAGGLGSNRGGSYESDEEHLRIAGRWEIEGTFTEAALGFRVVRTAP